MYASESRVQTKVCRFAAQTKAAPLRRLAPARHGRPSRARCPRYAAYRKASRSMPSALADRGKAPYAGLPPAGRACVPPPASGQPRYVRPSRRHLHGVCLQNTVCHCAPFTRTLPRTSTAARRSSSQKCMRSSCVRSRGSASPLRRGAAARQFPPSLCRCAHHPLRGPNRRASHRRFTLYLHSVGPSRYVAFLSSSSVAAHEELKKPPPLLRSPPTVHSAKSLLPHAGCRMCLPLPQCSPQLLRPSQGDQNPSRAQESWLHQSDAKSP